MSNEQGQRGNIWSTVIVVALMVGLLLVFNLIRGGSGGCALIPGSETAGQVSGGSGTGSSGTTTQSEEKPEIETDSLTLENEELKVSFLAWAYHPGFRITKAELKKYTKKIAADSTVRTNVDLLDANTGFEVLGKKDTSLSTIKFTDRTDTSVTFVWVDTVGGEIRYSVVLNGMEVNVSKSDSAAPVLFNCTQGLIPSEAFYNSATGKYVGDKSELSLHQIYYRDGQGKVQWLNANRINQVTKGKKQLEPGPYDWVALRSKYFAAIVMPSGPAKATILPRVRPDQRIGMAFDVQGGDQFSIFFVPQDFDFFAEKGHHLSRIVELGGTAFRWLGVGMLKLFQFLYGIFKNYGVAIIIFAILIKLIFLPLSQMQQRSMQKMQLIQPKIKELQERFKGDQQRIQEETMRLYRTHKVSPLGGCLPMLIQLPVFFGLYGVLRNYIALRGAPFVDLFTITVNKAFNFLFIHIPAGELTWLADLSQHDPFYILPVLMGVASVIQSLRTNVDPRQRYMTLLFPILITVVFLNFPSGLQLYWLFFNILSLIEYAVFRRGKTGGSQWQTKQPREIPSAKNSQKFSQR